MTNRRKPEHLKRRQYSLSLPAWYQPLLAIVDKSSNSNALAKLVTHAIKAGALHTLAPGLPSHLTDPGALAAYLTNQAAQPHNAAPTQPPAVIPACPSCGECVLDCECSEPLNPIPQPLVVTPAQAATPAQAPAQAPATPSIWDKPAEQLNDADLRELQRQAEASFLLNRPG